MSFNDITYEVPTEEYNELNKIISSLKMVDDSSLTKITSESRILTQNLNSLLNKASIENKNHIEQHISQIKLDITRDSIFNNLEDLYIKLKNTYNRNISDIDIIENNLKKIQILIDNSTNTKFIEDCNNFIALYTVTKLNITNSLSTAKKALNEIARFQSVTVFLYNQLHDKSKIDYRTTGQILEKCLLQIKNDELIINVLKGVAVVTLIANIINYFTSNFYYVKTITEERVINNSSTHYNSASSSVGGIAESLRGIDAFFDFILKAGHYGLLFFGIFTFLAGLAMLLMSVMNGSKETKDSSVGGGFFYIFVGCVLSGVSPLPLVWVSERIEKYEVDKVYVDIFSVSPGLLGLSSIILIVSMLVISYFSIKRLMRNRAYVKDLKLIQEGNFYSNDLAKSDYNQYI